MKKIDVEDKFQIKQLLYCDCVLAIKDYRYRSFGGFQLWWYDRQRDLCSCCESGWSDFKRKIAHHTLDRAAKILWHHRSRLFLRGKRLSEDRKLLAVRCLHN